MPTLDRRFIRANGEVVSEPGVAASLTALGFASTQAPSGTTTQCGGGAIVNGFPEGGGVAAGTYDNIEVPPGEICVLDGVTVLQSVTALAGSQLFIFSSQIGVDVLGLSAAVVQLNSGNTVGRNMDVQHAGGGPFASCAVDGSSITGNLSCTDNDPGSPIIRTEQGPVSIGGSVSLAGNVIPAGNVLLLLNADIGVNANITKNTGSGTKDVTGNTVGKKLDCKKNDQPFLGGPNVGSKAKGQCF